MKTDKTKNNYHPSIDCSRFKKVYRCEDCGSIGDIISIVGGTYEPCGVCGCATKATGIARWVNCSVWYLPSTWQTGYWEVKDENKNDKSG